MTLSVSHFPLLAVCMSFLFQDSSISFSRRYRVNAVPYRHGLFTNHKRGGGGGGGGGDFMMYCSSNKMVMRIWSKNAKM